MSQRQALQNIVSSTQRFLSNFPLSCPRRSDSHGVVHNPPLSLSVPLTRFRVKVMEAGLLPQISDSVLSRATELATFYEQSYQQACQRLMTLPNDKTSTSMTLRRLIQTYTYLFENNALPRFLDEALKAQALYRDRMTPASSAVSRRRFNSVCRITS